MTLFTNAHVVVMDGAGTEHEDGWIEVEDGRVAAVGAGEPPGPGEDLRGAVITPGLINTHHHLYQTLTRARAQQANLFEWLRELYPVWAGIDEEAEYAAARTGLAELALSGCTTVFDHHYVFPRGRTGLVEEPDEVLAETERLAGRYPELVVAPCSPFSVTGRLMEESAELARRLGLVLHTHLAETVEEEAYCRELYGCRPVEYLERLGWLAEDVWCAHCVHLDERDVATFGATGTGVAHCPTSNLRLGAGLAPVRALRDAGVRVGLGVDGSASNERGDLFCEVKQARRPRGLAHGRPRARRRSRSGGRPRPLRPASRRPALRGRRGGRPRRPARPRRRGGDRPRAPHPGAEARRVTVSTHVLDTERGRPAAGVRV